MIVEDNNFIFNLLQSGYLPSQEVKLNIASFFYFFLVFSLTSTIVPITAIKTIMTRIKSELSMNTAVKMTAVHVKKMALILLSLVIPSPSPYSATIGPR